MSRTREKSKGRRGGEAEHFAKIPASVLESEACLTLGHAAFRVLVIMAAQFRGHANGTMALTEKFAERYRFKGRDTLYTSLAALRERGLLVRTRRGIKAKNSFSLYALGWLPVTHIDGEPLLQPIAPSEVINSHGERAIDWRHWTPESLPSVGNDPAEIQTDGREWSLPKIGNNEAVSRPTIGITEPISRPTIGNTSRFSGRGAGVREHGPGSPAPVPAPNSPSRSRAVR